MAEPRSVEQMVRDILSLAIAEGLVGEHGEWSDPSPQARSSGELVTVANYLNDQFGEQSARIASLEAENDRLRESLTEALDGWEDAAPYKGDYLVEKHGDREDILRLRTVCLEATSTRRATGDEPGLQNPGDG